eukprot:gene13434-20694_t
MSFTVLCVGIATTVATCLSLVLGYYFIVFKPRVKKMAKQWTDDGIKDTASYSLRTKKPLGHGLPVRVLYATVKGRSKKFALEAAEELNTSGFTATVGRIPDDGMSCLLGTDPVLFVVPTYEDGKLPASCSKFSGWLQGRATDGPKIGSKLKYSILGLGHSDYGLAGTYNKACKDLHKMLKKAGCKPFGPGVVQGDEGKHMQETAYVEWLRGVQKGLEQLEDDSRVGVYEVGDEEDDAASNPAEDAGSDSGNEVGDVEDLVDSTPADPNAEMINPRMRKALTKQGYHLIGSHSGVKLCRWTKAQLRGRGGCYKHTFYGITSYQCMEMTPSLACANKCVFCWRHHTNPVSKEWKWKHDDPDFLIEKAIEGQRAMIKPLKGVPGVMADRYKDAFNPAHCALSLVGEPIIYPEINALIDSLHDRNISSFMVTNAQFPDAIETLRPVTQMYISVDAATKESMKAIDRPIFDDFWERFLQGVDAMRRKGQRTVFRLTLVKDWNSSEIEEYGKLIQRGQPNVVEVKGVTWCGESTASNLCMSNVPFHTEVVKFCEQLAAASGDNYAIASEHEHSCCVLIANKKFLRDGVWHTWMDFNKFHELVRSGKPFTSEDYLA